MDARLSWTVSWASISSCASQCAYQGWGLEPYLVHQIQNPPRKKGKKSVFVVILKLHCVSCLVSQLMVPKPLECNSDTSQIDDHVVLSFIVESALICAPLIELA